MQELRPRPTLFAACPMAVEIADKRYTFLLAAKFKIPMEIGCDVRPCPKCGAPLSWAYDHFFCRKCGLNKEEIQYD